MLFLDKKDGDKIVEQMNEITERFGKLKLDSIKTFREKNASIGGGERLNGGSGHDI